MDEHKYKYSRRAPNRYSIDARLDYLPDHYIATTRRKCSLHSKETVTYQVRCSCKWKDPRYYRYSQIFHVFNMHIKEAQRQGQLFDVQDR